MRKREYLFLGFVVIVAFWQVSFLQSGMKWDFVDAYLPSRYFFSESILNNQFPLWNPYLLYGTPIYADLSSVFSPEFWIIGNMFGYSNISLQYIFLLYIFIAGIAFFYFLKQFGTESKISLGLSVAYMLSGLSIGNAQHISFVAGYAILPFVITRYIRFLSAPNRSNFLLMAIALFVMVYASYPGLTIILGYFLFGLFVYDFAKSRGNKAKIRKLIVYHLVLLATTILFSSVYLVAYFQAIPFLSRYSGISAELALRHPFSLKSFLSFVLPMATGNESKYFETDVSMSNGYWGIISLVLFLYCLTRKVKRNESYVILGMGLLSLLASLGDQAFLRKILFDYVPFMDMFKYPAIFRSIAIFGFLAFVGINLDVTQLTKKSGKRMLVIAGFLISGLLALVGYSVLRFDNFVFFDPNKSFYEEILSSDRFNNIVFQGSLQVILLLIFGFIIWKVKEFKRFSSALLLLFVVDGIVATQLSINYTVISDTDPIKFYNYLKSSPKGFPVPELNPMGENSDKNASSEFSWMNNNVFPKKVTYDGLVSFKLDGYSNLANNYPALLEAIKKGPVVYFSDDLRVNTKVENFKSNTVFVSASDYNLLQAEKFASDPNDKLQITRFSPTTIELKTTTRYTQLLTYQQNYFAGWKVFVDGEEQDLINSNFAHMMVRVPQGDHLVVFKYSNPIVIYAFCFSMFVFVLLIGMWSYSFLVQHPEKKRSIIQFVVFGLLFFIVSSALNRYLYAKNKQGLTSVIVEKIDEWKKTYSNNINVFLSTQQNELGNRVNADTTCFVDEKTNLAALSNFMVHSETNYFVFAWQGGSVSMDILELIYSFYPTVMDQKRGNNSGVVLLSKSTGANNYEYCEDFEPGTSSGWPVDKSRLKVDTLTGNSTYCFGVDEQWGTTLTIPVNKEVRKLKKVLLVTDLFLEEKLVDIPLVFSVSREDKKNQYDAPSINRFVKYPYKWARAAVVFDVKTELHEGDLITIYFWNKDAGSFQIDNIKLKLFYDGDY
ncbi:YfhO family protein [Prolixibacteraceae bacterium Z1-6]|uniref:YfhO family protein n=1 Tax=Draconibacterium aestuarii TaxID=2998507 RepID=A0A9X3J6C0_9BACT|nr:YfhO family protein [Prolixibacteraceae bacterium Z1-6]